MNSDQMAEGFGMFIKSMRDGEPIPVNDVTARMFLSLMKFAYTQAWAVSFYVEESVPPDHFLVSPPHQTAPDPEVQSCLPDGEQLPDDTTHLIVAADEEIAKYLSDAAKQQAQEFARSSNEEFREVVVDRNLKTKQVFRDN